MKIPGLPRRFNKYIVLLVALEILSFVLVLVGFKSGNSYIMILIFVIVVVGSWQMRNYLKRNGKSETPTKKENPVLQELKKLPTEYSLLKDFTFDKRDRSDYLVIGPTGIWTIHVENDLGGEITYKKKVLLSGGKPLERDVLKEAFNEALNAQMYLSSEMRAVPVRPVIVFTHKKTKVPPGHKPAGNVFVVDLAGLNNLIDEYPIEPKLTPEQCSSLRDLLKKHSSII